VKFCVGKQLFTEVRQWDWYRRSIERIFCFPGVIWALASGAFRIVSDTLVIGNTVCPQFCSNRCGRRCFCVHWHACMFCILFQRWCVVVISSDSTDALYFNNLTLRKLRNCKLIFVVIFTFSTECFNEQEIRSCRTRSLSNATFSFLITWHLSSSKSAAVYKISRKSDGFLLRYGDISIFKMAAVRHLGIVLQPYETTHEVCCWPQLPVKFYVNLIHRSEDIAIWTFRTYGLKCLFRPQNKGFGGLWTPKCDYSSSRPPKGTSLYISASVKLSTVKKPLRGLTYRRVDRKCNGHTDRHTDTHTQVNLYSVCPCIALDRQ